MLIALYCILAILSFKLYSIKVTFQAFPVLLSAIIFGPIDGMIVGGVGEFIFQAFFSGYGLTITTPLWILPHLVSGLIVGIIAKKVKKTFFNLSFIASISAIIVTLLNIFALYVDAKLFNYTVLLFATLPLKLLIGILEAILFSLILPKLIEKFN